MILTLLPLPSPELLPKGSKEEQRDYVFYLAVGNYRLKVSSQSLPPTFPSHFPSRLAPWPSGRPRRAVGRGWCWVQRRKVIAGQDAEGR